MQLKSLHIQGFRSIRDLELTFEPGLTTLVGENGTGKSSIGLALKKLLTQATAGGENINPEDYPYGIQGPLTIQAVLHLSPSEIQDHVISPIMPQNLRSLRDSPFHKWLVDQGSDMKISLSRPKSTEFATLQWGDLNLVDNVLGLRGIDRKLVGSSWPAFADDFGKSGSNPNALPDGYIFVLPGNPVHDISAPLLNQYKYVDEFRFPPNIGNRTGAMESMSGSDTPSVLLNLKNHYNPRERKRYEEIKERFTTLLPHYKIEAVERSPGQGTPYVQFSVKTQGSFPLSVVQMSAGVQEILTLVTNLVAREGLVFFLEHPETHLHPHSRRLLQSFLKKASKSNQIIVVTHDPQFVDPRSPESLRRFWWTPENGTQVSEAAVLNSLKEKSQIETALRNVGTREVVFARSVLLVEGESESEFLSAVAPTLEYDIDAYSVSIIQVGGGDGFAPFDTLLDSLGIPHVNLRDKSWGHNPKYPPERFFSLDMELEEYLDKHGLAEMRKEIAKEVGGKGDTGEKKRQLASEMGRRLERDRIPPIFGQVLKATIDLATGKPQAAGR